MKKPLFIFAVFATAWTAAAAPVRTATEGFVTNRIAQAIAAIPEPDFSTNNSELVETIRSEAPTPNLSPYVRKDLQENGLQVITGTVEVIANHHHLMPTGGGIRLRNSPTGGYVDLYADGGLWWEYLDYWFTWPGVGQDIDLLRKRDLAAWARAANKPTYTASEVGATDAAAVTAMIREQSLGGIWDEDLQVWWTPHMRNGNLTYEATTNVNLNAEN